VLDVPVERWFSPADDVEHAALARATGPVLDVGCGPGRHLVALHQRGVFALGIDISPPLLDTARRLGMNVLERSVFGRIPGAGRWATVLLFDGNVGIGGDPVALLGRLVTLLRPGGRIIAESEPDDGPARVVRVRAESAAGAGPWFPWTTVGPARLEAVVAGAGLHVRSCWTAGGRRFAEITTAPSGGAGA